MIHRIIKGECPLFFSSLHRISLNAPDPDNDDDTPPVGCGGDRWFQDELEIGYTAWPGGGMHVTWDLYRLYNGSERFLDEWVVRSNPHLFGSDMGFLDEIKDSGGAPIEAEGGNIEVIPQTNGNGIVFAGSISSAIKDFIEAQGAQEFISQSPGTDWLSVGHIDEIVSLNSTVYVASAKEAYDLLAPMDEEKSLIVQDVVNANHLKNMGAEYSESDAKEGSASMDFESSQNDYLIIDDVALSDDFPLKNGSSIQSFSYCFWIKCETIAHAGFMDIISKSHYQDNKNSFSIGLNQVGSQYQFAVVFFDENNNMIRDFYSGSPQNGRWYHVGVAYNHVTGSCRMRIWDDTAGQVLGSGDLVFNAGSSVNITDSPLCIGTSASLQGGFVDGLLDDIQVFGTALSATEIDSVRNGGGSGAIQVWDFEQPHIMGGTNVMIVNHLSITPADWIGGIVQVVGGNGNGQARKISAITDNGNSTTITVTRDWTASTILDPQSTIEMIKPTAYRPMFTTGVFEWGVATGGTSTTLVDSTRNWNGEFDEVDRPSNNTLYSYIMIVEGTGAGQILPIGTSQGDMITLADVGGTIGQITFSDTPDESSSYVIVHRSKTWGLYPYEEVEDSQYFEVTEYPNVCPACTTVRYFMNEYGAEHNTGGAIQDQLETLKTTLSNEQLIGEVISFTEVPVFYTYTGVSSDCLAWMGNTVNLLNAGTLVTNEPFVFGADTISGLNANFMQVSGTYVDDWYYYHAGRGEIHCGTKVKRNPGNLSSWWDNIP